MYAYALAASIAVGVWLVLQLRALAARCAALETSLGAATALTRDLGQRVEELNAAVAANNERVSGGDDQYRRALKAINNLRVGLDSMGTDVRKNAAAADAGREELAALVRDADSRLCAGIERIGVEHRAAIEDLQAQISNPSSSARPESPKEELSAQLAALGTRTSALSYLYDQLTLHNNRSDEASTQSGMFTSPYVSVDEGTPVGSRRPTPPRSPAGGGGAGFADLVYNAVTEGTPVNTPPDSPQEKVVPVAEWWAEVSSSRSRTPTGTPPISPSGGVAEASDGAYRTYSRGNSACTLADPRLQSGTVTPENKEEEAWASSHGSVGGSSEFHNLEDLLPAGTRRGVRSSGQTRYRILKGLQLGAGGFPA
jgi:hypothetical protein